MKTYTLEDLEEQYSLDFERAINEIKNLDAKLVLVQFPDGLKHYATAIVKYLEPLSLKPKSPDSSR